MAQVAGPGHHACSSSMGTMAPSAPTIEMLPNPDFSFPRVDPATSRASHQRPKSVSGRAARPQTAEQLHRRGVSALPSFCFNANDASGLTGDVKDEADVGEPLQMTPSRGSHRRNTSELVGGLGLTDAISTSPTRSTALPVPPRQHRSRHSRSQLTLSAHDLSSIMSPPESHPRLSTSLPNTPIEPPTGAKPENHCSFSPSLEDASARPPSRPRVEFSDDVEYIPRPLSTISSETGSSMSTVRGHSVNNSISSVLSLSTPSPPSARVRASFLETTFEDEPRSTARSSLEISRRIEREGQWLSMSTLGDTLERPLTAPVSQKLTFVAEEHPPGLSRVAQKKRQTLGYKLSLDRRKSESAIGMHAGGPSRLSALSLQEQALVAPYAFEVPPFEADRRSSSRKLKDWAVSKLSRKSKEWPQPGSEPFLDPPGSTNANIRTESKAAVAETDLDAVFALDCDEESSNGVRTQATFDASEPFFTGTPSSIGHDDDNDDSCAMLDLDAALGPFKSPHLGSHRARRELHSSRGTKHFIGPGGHYLPNPTHRRTESAPMLTPFEQARTSTPPQAAMADVFEEDEEDMEPGSTRRTSTQSMQDEEAGMGVEIVDSEVSMDSSTNSLNVNDGLRIQHGEREAERPHTSYANLASRLSTPIVDRRCSIIEQTIMEEASPIEPTIVESHEEPRALSFAKSSDGSETPTIMATSNDMLALPDSQPQLTSPEGYQSSAFSSPEFGLRQNSFDTSRMGTSASSMTDHRTMSSYTTGAPSIDAQVSVDDVPSLTASSLGSSPSTTMLPNLLRRDQSGSRTPSGTSGTPDAGFASDRRRKRASIQSLSQLVPFGSRSAGSEGPRPLTATESGKADQAPKKAHRLKKLMFWKSKNRQAGPTSTS